MIYKEHQGKRMFYKFSFDIYEGKFKKGCVGVGSEVGGEKVSCEFKPMKHRRKSTGRVLGKMFTFSKEQGTYKELDPFPPFCFWSL